MIGVSSPPIMYAMNADTIHEYHWRFGRYRLEPDPGETDTPSSFDLPARGWGFASPACAKTELRFGEARAKAGKLMLRQAQHEGKREVLTLSLSKGEPVEG